MTTNADYRTHWQAPPRPEWVQRLNEEGACMDIQGVVPLDESSLLAAAERNTGLSDFGAEDWREPFRVFITSLEQEAALNLTGRLRTRSEILHLLEARLRIEDTYKRHPQIEQEQIHQPIIVIGQGRSGTSFLVNLLAAHPDNGALTHWESMFPCPPPAKSTYKTDPRIAQADVLIKQWYRVTPELMSMHEFAGDVPQEFNQAMAMNFMSPSWLGALGQVPSYDRYMMTRDITPALRYLKRVLKLLQWQNPRRHWALKDVKSLDHLDALLDVFPDACFVWPHRDPVRALASVVNLIGTLHWGRSDQPFKGGSFEFVTDVSLAAARFNAALDRLEAGAVPPQQMHHLLYRDLVRDPLASVEGMYRHFGMKLSEHGRRALTQYLADNPRDARPAHRFNAGSQSTVSRARAAFKRYQDTFGIPVE